MRILYLSCHEVLERDELALFSELGHEVFSPGGAFQNPKSDGLKRPPVDAEYHEHLAQVAIQCSKEHLHKELIDWADVIMIMHRPDWVLSNWDATKHKRVVWRTIGQSVSDQESSLALPRAMGLKIVRYSPREETIKNFAGSDAVIRFYKDENEFGGHTGKVPSVMTVAQCMKSRGKFCGFDIFELATRDLARFLYGPGNEDSGIPGGYLSYEELKQAYRDNRVYFYTGTYPASYTLGFIEAMMSGIPIVAIGYPLADLGIFQMDAYEVPQILTNGRTGYIADTILAASAYVKYLIDERIEARRMGEAARQKAIELFGKQTALRSWKAFFDGLSA